MYTVCKCVLLNDVDWNDVRDVDGYKFRGYLRNSKGNGGGDDDDGHNSSCDN